jgi:hypothetical protein
MDMATKVRAKRLRPAALRSKPVRVERVFDDPDHVLQLIHERAPYPTLAAYHGFRNDTGEANEFPWFLTRFEDDRFIDIPSFIQAAREAFSAEFVRPTSCTLNLNAPMKIGPPHVDLPVFRGFASPEVPIWLLMSMSYSRLFHAWMVPVASGLVWFYRGAGGAFEYWPDGPNGASAREDPPLWNLGVMSDNEVMWHRVRDIGDPQLQEELDPHLRPSATMHHAGDGWEIRDGDERVISLGDSDVRISMLWKAYVFKDAAHLASFEDRAYDLDADQLVDIFIDDLRERGLTVSAPSDPFEDPEWRNLLQTTYGSPFGGAKSPYY